MSTIISIALHAMIIAAVIVGTRRASTRTGHVRSVEGGAGHASAGVSGVPATHLRNLHSFTVVDAESGTPIAEAEVRDVLGGVSVRSLEDGAVSLVVRPGARLLVRVSKTGYEPVAFEVANLTLEPPSRVIKLRRARS